MSEELAVKLARTQKSGYVIAPAGFGKTHLIATAVNNCKERQLILTHTYAGVNSLKTKLADLKTPSRQYHVDTIASFSLKFTLAYPSSSGWNGKEPSSQTEWLELYDKTTQLLGRPFVKEILKCTYGGVFIDEYQDCSNKQHSIIEKLIDVLPSRLLGDPLQAIFDFNEDGAIDWEEKIIPKLPKLGELHTPWRWKKSGNEELGQWLYEIRKTIVQGKIPPPPSKPIKGFSRIFTDIENYNDPKRLSAFRSTAQRDGTCIVVFPGENEFKQKTHMLSRNLSGQFTSLEEVEGKSMESTIKALVLAKSPKARLKVIIKFAQKCMTGVKKQLPEMTINGGKTKITKQTKYPQLVEACNSYLDTGKSEYLILLLKGLVRANNTKIYRRDLLQRFLSVLNYAQIMPIQDADKRFRQDFRQLGRPVWSKNQIATTLLVKGLEYDHCIVTNVRDMSAKEFYVSVTRGSSSLTIITKPET